jgi:Mg-chelatase subunit ChlI
VEQDRVAEGDGSREYQEQAVERIEDPALHLRQQRRPAEDVGVPQWHLSELPLARDLVEQRVVVDQQITGREDLAPQSHRPEQPERDESEDPHAGQGCAAWLHAAHLETFSGLSETRQLSMLS